MEKRTDNNRSLTEGPNLKLTLKQARMEQCGQFSLVKKKKRHFKPVFWQREGQYPTSPPMSPPGVKACCFCLTEAARWVSKNLWGWTLTLKDCNAIPNHSPTMKMRTAVMQWLQFLLKVIPALLLHLGKKLQHFLLFWLTFEKKWKKKLLSKMRIRINILKT